MKPDNPFQLTTEDTLKQGRWGTIQRFWQQVAQQKSIITPDGCCLHYARLCPADCTAAVIVSPGRLESYIKYQELAFDLVNQGYGVFILDHRGQGFSQRPLNNRHKGDICYFDQYTQDMAFWIEQVILPQQYRQLFGLGHSMGSTILARYQQCYPGQLDALVLASPMFGIALKRLPKWVAYSLSMGLSLLCSACHIDPIYVPGKGNYKASAFETNDLTHSPIRYQLYRELYQHYPQIQLGGPTVRWVHQSLLGAEKAVKNASKITIPTQVIEAGGDTVVCGEAIKQFCAQLSPTKEPLLISNAKHELFQETDAHRLPTLNAALHHFSRYIENDVRAFSN